MNIRHAIKDDIETIQAVAAEVWPVTFGEILSRTQIEYMMDMMYSVRSITEQMEKLGHRYFFAEEDGEIYGYLSYEPNYHGKQWTKIHKIYVLTSAQGKGAGRLMIEEAVRIARQNGDCELSLNVNRYNKAIRFYYKMGFEIVDQEDIDIGGGFFMNDYVMNRKL